jgi:hypothetical protein
MRRGISMARKKKQKVIRQRRRKETVAQSKLRRLKINEDKNRIVNEYRKGLKEQMEAEIKALELKEAAEAVTVTEDIKEEVADVKEVAEEPVAVTE